MIDRFLCITTFLGFFGVSLLFSSSALANLDTGEATNPAQDRDSFLVITNPSPRSSVTAGESLSITIVVNKPFDSYNGVEVKIAKAIQTERDQKFHLTSTVKYLPATKQQDGTYVVTYTVPVNYSGWLWLMPDDVGDRLLNV